MDRPVESLGNVAVEYAAAEARRCLVVLGMHRSGTSALTRVLSLLGAALPKHIMGASLGNETGHWEPERLVAYHDKLLAELGSHWSDWQALDFSRMPVKRRKEIKTEIEDIVAVEYGDAPLFVVKDPRICRFAPLFLEALEDAGIDARGVLMFRNPLEVAESLQRRDGMTRGQAGLLWLRHVLDAEEATRGQPRAIMAYDSLLADWKAALARLTQQMGAVWAYGADDVAGQVERFLAPGQRHHARSSEEVLLDPMLRHWIGEIYSALLILERNPAAKSALAAFDRVRGEFTHAAPVMHRLYEEIRNAHEAQASSLKAALVEAKGRVEELAAKLADREAEFERRKCMADDAERRAGEMAATLAAREEQTAGLKAALSETESKAEALTAMLAEREAQSNSLRMAAEQLAAALPAREEEVCRLRAELSGTESKVEALKATLAERNARAETLVHELSATRSESNQIRAQLAISEEWRRAYESSTSWRITAPLRWIMELYKRRSLHNANLPARVSRLVQENALRESGNRWCDLSADDVHVLCSDIELKAHINPEISIILPIYNQIGHTIECLRSLRRQVTPYTFEVIIMDDCSPDLVNQRLGHIPGIRYHRNQTNLGFLRNCNRGASLARGRYLVFLNNDTRADSSWLHSLRQTFEEHPNVGIVGAKLVYPDGRLQEAGGIVWQDGSAWNWGRLEDPNHPAYNYVRDVDYVSGASLMIERDLFEKLNRFDERYEVAYYEDTDICFSVRAAGKRVLYQPKSVLIHYEGISSGTDESKGIKRYQATNRELFFQKWVETLKLHSINGTSPEIASDRSPKGHILIIDACTPTPDQDSGSLDMVNLIRILINLGYRVHFIPFTNFLNFGSYTDRIQRMGVKCIFAPYYKTPKAYLKDSGALFDYVILARVPVAHDTIDEVRQYCKKAKVIFYTVDLHFLRDAREAELNGDVEMKARADETRSRELALMDKTDVTIVLSEAERGYLQRLGKNGIEVIPLIREITSPSGVPFERRSGALFIGGFQHRPNVDAVAWLVKEIWPHVRGLTAERRLEPIKLHIYGSKMPEHFKQFACADINVHGYVYDLADAFSRIRISLAPLRYGAGLKGKIASSFGFGVPVVGTSIAFEGIGAEYDERIRTSSDDAASLARQIVDVYSNKARWQLISELCVQYHKSQYSIDAISPKIETLLMNLARRT